MAPIVRFGYHVIRGHATNLWVSAPLAMVKDRQRVWIDAEIKTTDVFKGAPGEQMDKEWSRISDGMCLVHSLQEMKLADRRVD